MAVAWRDITNQYKRKMRGQVVTTVQAAPAAQVVTPLAQVAPVQVARVTPVQVAQAVPVQVAQAVPVQVAQAVPVQVPQVAPVQVPQVAPVQVARVAPLQVTQVTPVPVTQVQVPVAQVQVPVAAPVVAVHAEPAYPPQPYHFSYTTVTEEGAHSHEETADGANRRQGAYTINIADGRQRIVRYVADENGFRAAIETNELGTESNSPAGVQIYSTAPTGPEAAILAEAYLSRTITGFPYYRKASASASRAS
ncbi:hypothetical protein BIW11_04688 [Tropilaelaps mercedesae]|uniref:Cuticle protein 10.9-like n=1 Tax=Tropilaelaps mercedesae TaxID=418985 RepID=A0A1V9X3I6_9ACAR|nr:hypothetical protein BIW11_04688 [Tropilaelaps mercedesae]